MLKTIFPVFPRRAADSTMGIFSEVVSTNNTVVEQGQDKLNADGSHKKFIHFYGSGSKMTWNFRKTGSAGRAAIGFQ